jgi:uncharacterized membrane protein YkvA (DUF1232 family)
MGRRVDGKLRRARRFIRFGAEIKALYLYVKDPGVPLRHKALIIGALIYFVLVVDLVPDILGIPGYLDDAAVVAVTVAHLGAALKPYLQPPERRTP